MARMLVQSLAVLALVAVTTAEPAPLLLKAGHECKSSYSNERKEGHTDNPTQCAARCRGAGPGYVFFSWGYRGGDHEECWCEGTANWRCPEGWERYSAH